MDTNTTTDPFDIDCRVIVDSDADRSGTVTAFHVNKPIAYVQLDADAPNSPTLVGYHRLTRI